MKKSFVGRIIAVAAVAALATITSCKPAEEQKKEVQSLKVEPGELTIVIGTAESLSVKVTPADAEYLYATWTSSAPDIAEVNKNGTVKAKKEGSATISATVSTSNGDVTGTCAVTVVKNTIKVTGITVNPSSITLGKGTTETLTAQVQPADAANQNVVWSTSNDKVATVAGGVVTGVGAGQCDIIAKSEDGGFEAKCFVSVTDVPVEAIAFSNGSPNTIVVNNNGTYSLFVTFTPENTSERDITWEVSGATAASVAATGEGQADVTFNPVSIGLITVKATVSGTSCSASQQFFLTDEDELVKMPQGKIVVGRKCAWQFNVWDYSGASDLKWEVGSRTFEGHSVEFAPEQGGENTVFISGKYNGAPFKIEYKYQAEEWYINESIDGANPRNTYPVFNKEATRAYFVTRGARRLYELNLEEGHIGWMFDLNEGKNDNGYQIAVNPKTGDIYCGSQYHIYCVTPEGTQKWAIEVPGSKSCSAIAGSGPGLSNDCNTVFFPVADGRFIAVNAATGAILDSFDLFTIHMQFAVYGNDDIVIHTSTLEGGPTPAVIKFTRFDGSKFTEIKTVESNTTGSTDITSPAISRDQKTAWFSCEIGGLISANLETKTFSGVMDFTGHRGILMQPVVTDDDKYLFFASAHETRVNRVIAEMNPTDATLVIRYNNGSDNLLNFTSLALDTEGNAYFFINEDGAGNSVFYRIPAAGGAAEVIASIPKQNKDPQGFFNFGGGYLIGGGGSNTQNRVLVRCIEAERGHGWSGPGGDLCATKNANLVYGN